MRHRGVFLVLMITWLTILSITRCQSICPTRCLCHFNEIPRTVQCSKQGLQTFPENISDVVSKFAMSNDSLLYQIFIIIKYKMTINLLYFIVFVK